VGKLDSIQTMRGLAALLVAALHLDGTLGLLGHPQALPDLTIGAFGVDLFFVISGFIMVHTAGDDFGSARAAGAFLLRRSIRVVPLYWAMTLVFVAVALVAPFAAEAGRPTLAQVSASLLFLPYPRADGAVLPVHPLGWTLNYEMLFYALFAAGLALPRRLALVGIALLLCGGALAARVLGPLPLPWSFWLDSIVAEFAFGMGLAVAHARGVRLPRIAGAALILAGAALALLYVPHLNGPVLPRGLGWGVPALMVMAGAVLVPWRRAPGWLARPLVRLGDASYSLYLLHLLVFLAGRRIWTMSGLAALAHPLVFAALAMAGAIVASLLMWRWFEVPVTAWLARRLAPRRATPAGTPALPGARP
jgi:peptidoglycan/LPS O-acetylase OafA/YrhL